MQFFSPLFLVFRLLSYTIIFPTLKLEAQQLMASQIIHAQNN